MSASLPADIAGLLQTVAREDAEPLSTLIPPLYGELRRIARRHLRHDKLRPTMATTSLVHEAYLRLAGAQQLRIQDRSHLLALASSLMRRILVDHARSRCRAKRTGGTGVPLEDAFAIARERAADLVRLDDCLDALAHVDPRKAHVVEMRFFGGLSVQETAQALNVSEDTIGRDWRLAKVWLMRELKRSGP